jgi:quinoprotein glucose dehydrogenase
MRPTSLAGRLTSVLVLLIVCGVVAGLMLRTRANGAVGIDWPMHGGDSGHRQYSALDQITPSNVSNLAVQWTYHTGDARPNGRSQIQCNPIVVHGVLYATSPQLKTFALEAATGKELWVFDPFKKSKEDTSTLGVNRGVVYWEDGSEKRIFVAAGKRLYSLNAATGVPATEFGDGGSVSLMDGLVRDVSKLYVLSNTPGAIYKDLLILGTRVSEGPGPTAPGHVRAYDVRTGKIRWTFHTIPQPGEFGYDTWPADAYTRVGGANAWSGISVDADRGLVFLPTGSAAFDFWGGNRHGANLFANCLLALKADTGERVWHFQTVHHDLWDRDLPTAPVLVNVQRNGKEVAAVAQVLKSGVVFVFNRETGEPLFPIEERPVPPSDLEGEAAWPTQPFPLAPPPFAKQRLTEADLTTRTPAAHAAVLEQFRKVRSNGQFVPPSTQGTIIYPGFDGGGEWGGSAFDPKSGRLFVNANEMAWILTMVRLKQQTGPNAEGQQVYQLNCAVCHGADRKGVARQMVPNLVDIAKRLPRAEAARVVRQGKGVMPSFQQLSVAQRKAVVDFLYGIVSKQAPKADDDETPEPSVLYSHTGYNRFFDPDGYPAVATPWGTLNAIDLNAGTIAWTVPLGDDKTVGPHTEPTGTENYGGPILTASGLLFIGATRDEKFRAFDASSGKVLWETSLPAGGYATPSTYSVNGKQYVVIAAGGGKMGTKSGDAYIAYALPDNTARPQ